MSKKGSKRNGTKNAISSKVSGMNKLLSTSRQKELNMLCNQLLNSTTQISFNEPLTAQWEHHKEINNLLIRIMEIESDLKVPLPDRNQEKMEQFTKWTLENGAVIDGVSIAAFEGYGYGVKADRDLKQDEIFMQIPRSIMFTADYVFISPLRDLFADDMLLQQMPNVALAMLLLVERFRTDKRSFWADYFEIFPAKYLLPTYYSLADFEELRGSPAFEGSLKLCKNIARQYAYFRNIFQKRKDETSEILRDVFTYEQYRWAVATVMTRQNCIPSVDHKNEIYALIPFWDICNHRENKNGVSEVTTDYDVETKMSKCSICEDCKSGEQVFIYYGVRSNVDFVMHNGFFCPDNRNDQISLKFGLPHTDPFYEFRAAMLKQFGIFISGEFVVKDKVNEPFNNILLGFIRILKLDEEYFDYFAADEPTFNLLKSSIFDYDEAVCPAALMEYLPKLDTTVLSYLKTRVTLLIKSYSTTSQEDEKLLKNEDLPDIRRLIILQRKKEKCILERASDYCTKMIAKGYTASKEN